MPFGEAAHRGAAHQLLRGLDRALIAFGIACLLCYGFMTAQAALYQRQANAQIDRMIAARKPESPTMTRVAPKAPSLVVAPLARGSVIGRVDVPRLKLSAAIAEGDD